MKILTERTQIAKAMNFGKYPVLELNLEKEIRMGTEHKLVGFEGCGVRVPWDYHGETMYEDAEIAWYMDSPNELHITSGGCCLHASFGYEDVMEMLKNANTPILDKNQKFILVVHTAKAAWVVELETADYKNIHCMNCLRVKDEKLGDIVALAAAYK